MVGGHETAAHNRKLTEERHVAFDEDASAASMFGSEARETRA
jgi:hypothetical protein